MRRQPVPFRKQKSLLSIVESRFEGRLCEDLSHYRMPRAYSKERVKSTSYRSAWLTLFRWCGELGLHLCSNPPDLLSAMVQGISAPIYWYYGLLRKAWSGLERIAKKGIPNRVIGESTEFAQVVVRPPGFGPGSLAWKANGRLERLCPRPG